MVSAPNAATDPVSCVWSIKFGRVRILSRSKRLTSNFFLEKRARKHAVQHLLWLQLSKGAIQIIRDTLDGGSKMCHTSFITLRNTNFKTFGSEKFCLTARLDLKRYFLYYSFCCLR
jgi:hypothetical protein